jgi:hypothetical protein
MQIKNILLSTCVCMAISLTSASIKATENDSEQTTDVINIHVGQREADGSYLFNPQGRKEISLSTLDWAPYIAQNICGQG